MSSSVSYQQITISTSRGDVSGRYYAASHAIKGIVWIGGIGGFWDGPAGNLYTHLSESFQEQQVSSIRLNLRRPTDMDGSVADTLAAIDFLRERRIRGVGLVGHSFAAAVAIRAAVSSGFPSTVVALAVQSHGAETVAQLPSHCSLLLIHGTADEVLHVSNSEYIAALANVPKQLLTLQGAKHTLDEAAHDVHREVEQWLRINLRTLDLALPPAGYSRPDDLSIPETIHPGS
jgi:alpha/beta superfamily hydrolase